jgi:[protein-PII] uridylyltransferase
MSSKYEHTSTKLQQKIEGLIARYLKAKEPDFLRLHAQAIDDYFHESFETSIIGPQMGINKNPYAIIALGGYGRREQCIHSDVDILFLFEKRVPQKAEQLIQEIIYPLWDIGLDVGYAIRSLNECVRLASRDFDILTPILDARFICGVSHLYSDLIDQLRDKILQTQSRTIIDWLVQRNRARHFQFGDSAYLLEPNLKEGQGGLRDYHTMLWIAKIEFNLKLPRDFVYLGLLSHDEFETLANTLGFIWDVRNRIHRICGRKCDQLHFENQIKLSKTLKYRKTKGHAPVEKFLGELHGRMEYLKQQHLMFLHELGIEKKRKRKTPSKKKSNVQGLDVIKWGMLNFRSPEAILKSPDLLIKIFEESSRLKIPLSAEAKRLVREFSYLVDKHFRKDTAICKSFERILIAPAPTFNVLNEMLNTGFLQLYIPEFGKIVNRIQYDEYHLYPVDKHSLRTVQTIKRFSKPEAHPLEPLYNRLYKELGNKKLLLWAALLHDIGKAYPLKGHASKGAATVRKILTNKGLTPKEVETIAFLVEEHLLLIETATRRDIHDEETAIACARKIKDVTRLKMLYLLTVADSISTGPMAWSDWTATILRDFFLKVLNILEKGELATQKTVEAVAEKKNRIFQFASTKREEKELQRIFPIMSPRYFLYTAADDIYHHLKLYNKLGAAEFIWDIEQSKDANRRAVTICAKDRPGLISKIAGVFTLNNIDILNVQVFTWRNDIALDIFNVKPPPDLLFEDEKWKRAKDHLKSALAGELDLTKSLKKKISTHGSRKPKFSRKPPQIVVDNTSSSFFTIVEVHTYDFLGLLYSITDALYRCGLNIWVAKIATKVDQVVDVFYVRDLNGQKVNLPEQEEKIKTTIVDMLPKYK